MAFTREEFDIMMNELLNTEPASFEMLYCIARKTLMPSIIKWCQEDPILAGRSYEEDILHKIYIKLRKVCVTGFFLRNGIDNVNNDPDGFRNWMFEVARNCKRDFANKLRRRESRISSVMPEDVNLSDREDEMLAERETHIRLLSEAFRIVIDSDSQIYKVLTWVALCVCTIDLGMDKCRAPKHIVNSFENKTLREMRDEVFDAANRIPWMRMTFAQKQKIERALDEPYDEKRRYGDVTYKEFFMKKGGTSTISDWVNRMNSIIKREINDEAHNS